MNKHYIRRPNANLSCFQKSTFYIGIKIFNSLPPSLTLQQPSENTYIQIPSASEMHFLCVQMICNTVFVECF